MKPLLSKTTPGYATTKAIAVTAAFPQGQGKVEAMLPDSPYTAPRFVKAAVVQQ